VVAALETRVRRRLAGRREVRSLTTQARLSARAMLLLAPAFLGLLTLLDPQAMAESLRRPASRAALGAGLGLQLVGAGWISRIVARPLREARPGRPRSRFAGLPVLRAVSALAGGRSRGRSREASIADEVAQVADLMAFALDAGVTPTRALELAAPVARGEAGDRLRATVAAMRAGTPRAAALRAHAFQASVASPFASPSSPYPRLVEALTSAEALGVPVAASLRALADDVRDERAAELTEQVRAASIKVLVPLGLVILPAFVLSCLVPLFLGGLRGLSLG
jgi:Flp pilus assembly protein TadB